MLGNIGTVCLRLEQYTEAESNLLTALKISRNIGLRSSEATVYRSLAELYFKLEQFERAKGYCEQAIALASELGIPLLQECQKLESKIDRVFDSQS